MKNLIKKLLVVFFLSFLLFNELEGQTSIQNFSKRDENNLSIVVTRGFDFLYADPGNSKTSIFGPIFNQSILSNGEFSVGLKRVLPGNFSFKADFSYSHYTGTDSLSQLSYRGYSFNSDVFKLRLRAEYSIYIGDEYSLYRTSSFYPFIGIGILNSNAKLQYTPRGNYLYKPNDIALVIPFGIGYQYDMDQNFSIGCEFKYEYTTSDFIDGYKPPQPQSNSNDFIFGVALVLTYKIHQYSRSTYN